jgi:hypothetical protein
MKKTIKQIFGMLALAAFMNMLDTLVIIWSGVLKEGAWYSIKFYLINTVVVWVIFMILLGLKKYMDGISKNKPANNG